MKAIMNRIVLVWLEDPRAPGEASIVFASTDEHEAFQVRRSLENSGGNAICSLHLALAPSGEWWRQGGLEGQRERTRAEIGG